MTTQDIIDQAGEIWRKYRDPVMADNEDQFRRVAAEKMLMLDVFRAIREYANVDSPELLAEAVIRVMK